MFICLLENNIICEKSIEDEHLSSGSLYVVEWVGMIDFSFTFPPCTTYFFNIHKALKIECILNKVYLMSMFSDIDFQYLVLSYDNILPRKNAERSKIHVMYIKHLCS